MNKLTFTGLAILSAAGVTLTACGASTSPNATTKTAPASAQNSVAVVASPSIAPASKSGGPEAGGEGGTEAALVTYADAKQGFSIDHPAPWTQDTSVTNGVKFNGGDDSMVLEFVTPSTKGDTIAYAKSDVASVEKAFPGFKQLSLAPSTEVKGAVILGFEAQGKSAVTGKAYAVHNERYYIPLADGRIAVLTVAGPANHYDREGIRDIALTLKVTK